MLSAQTLHQLARGERSPDVVAVETGLSVEHVRGLTAAYVDGLGRPKPRPIMRGVLVAAAVVLFGVGGRAVAQATCTAPAIWATGLTPFCPDSPALANDVNGNFSRLVDIIQQRTGSVSGTFQTGAATFTGPATFNAAVTTTGNATVGGTLTATALSTRVIRVAPTTSVQLPFTGTMTNTDLTSTFSLPTTSTVDITYSISAEQLSTGFMVTRMLLDGSDVPEARVVSGATVYVHNTAHVVTRLAAGSHTVTIQYRANGIINIDTSTDYMGRSLQIHILGN